AGRTSIAFARFFEEAVFPPGVVSVVTVLGPEAGDALVRHPDVGKITFTGETATARIITARSADTLKRLAFELGGKSANVVFADADLDAAARGAPGAGFTRGAGPTRVAGARPPRAPGIPDAPPPPPQQGREGNPPRRPARPEDRHGPARLRAPVREGPLLPRRRAPRGRGGRLRRRARAGALRGGLPLREGLLRAPHPLPRRAQRHADLPRGDLWPGDGRDPLPRRGPGRRDRARPE